MSTDMNISIKTFVSQQPLKILIDHELILSCIRNCPTLELSNTAFGKSSVVMYINCPTLLLFNTAFGKESVVMYSILSV